MIRSATLPFASALPSLPDNHRLRLFSGSSNSALSQEVSRYLGIDLGPMIRKRFADGELYVQIQESIRGCDVYLMQPTCWPVNDHLMELLIMIDACRRASARQITAVLPYYGYARADRKTEVVGDESNDLLKEFCPLREISVLLLKLKKGISLLQRGGLGLA